jgi:hypothetical protein
MTETFLFLRIAAAGCCGFFWRHACGFCVVVCEMMLMRLHSLADDAESSGSDSEGEKEEGDSDEEENEAEGVEDDDVDGVFRVLHLDVDFV